MRKLITAATIAALSFSNPAIAWDGISTGLVSRIDVVPGTGNYDTRVYLAGGQAFCNGQIWAAVNSNIPNYNAMTATLLTAKVTRSTVTVYTNKDAQGNCVIGYVSIS